MSRSLVFALLVACGLGCQGQSNPFMRTTVPPPATGVGAPTDPYYNNSGRSQPPPVSTAAPGPVPTAPVVPPPDKRFTQPGGFNFPQGSVIHRKAVDPASDDFRTGTTAIARAARPRSMIGGGSHTQIADAGPEQKAHANELPSESSREVVQASASEEPSDDASGDPAASPAAEVATVEPQSEVGSESEPAADATQAAGSEAGAATMKIVASEDAAAKDAESELAPDDSKSPFTAVAKAPTSLTVAPPTASSTAPSEATIAATAGNQPSEGAGQARFYYDRKHDLHPAKAQRVAFLGDAASTANNAVFAEATAANGGIDGEPDGASAYAFHRQYQWLRGKLEYSSTAKRWKLRYIPIDGTTDQFGGSVVLPSSSLLDGMHSGEMVTARGTPGVTPAEHGRFAPLYQLSALERQ
jgi:hypothetical protein